MTYRFLTPALGGRLILLALVWVSFAATTEQYRSFDNLYAMLEGFALLGLVALGVSVTMIAGELDLSVASVAAVAGIIAVELSGLGLVPCVVLAALCGVAFGAVQGWVIAWTGINSLVFTIATLIGIRGVAHVLAPSPTLLPFDRIDISDAIVQRFWIFSPFSLTTIAMMVLVGFFLAYTAWGREIYAIGGGRHESAGAGVSQTRAMVIAFAISAGCAALAGSLAALKSASAAPFAYEPLLLSAVTAALVGGISLYGGRGHIFSLAIGVLTLRFLISGFSARGAPTYIESLATGLLLLGVLVVEFSTESPQVREWRERRALRRALTAPATAPPASPTA
jgi:ribose/xylose/arabinose/galactoside ABC-type transport system permease subunit